MTTTAPQGWLVPGPGSAYVQIQSSDAAGESPVDMPPRLVLRFSSAFRIEDRTITTIAGQPVYATLVAPNTAALAGDWGADPTDVMARALAALRDRGYLDLSAVANFPY